MNILTRDLILAADDLKLERVDVPEWNGSVFIKVLTGEEKDAFEASLIEGGRASLKQARAKLGVLCMANAEGVRLFTDDDVAALGAKSGVALDRIGKRAQRLNKMNDKDLEDLKGN